MWFVVGLLMMKLEVSLPNCSVNVDYTSRIQITTINTTRRGINLKLFNEILLMVDENCPLVWAYVHICGLYIPG